MQQIADRRRCGTSHQRWAALFLLQLLLPQPMGNSPLLVPQGAARYLHCSNELIRGHEETAAALLSPAPPLVPLWRPRYPVFQALRNMDLAAPRETRP